MRIFNLEIKASRRPWQENGYWNGGKANAPLNYGGARFGGGWKYKFGIDIGGSTVLLNLIWGMVRISKAKK